MSWKFTVEPPLLQGGDIVTEIAQNGLRYRVHQFTTVGTSSLVVMEPGQIEYLVVAGGGGGGGSLQGGGGGAGGLLSGKLLVSDVGVVSITIGSGGIGWGKTGGPSGGSNSVLSLNLIGGPVITSIGGGRGGGEEYLPTNGGSGGGGSHSSSSIVGLGTPGQGFNGGRGITAGDNYSGGGGGGAGGPAPDATYSSLVGGPGLNSNITGSVTTYAYGGTGSRRANYPNTNGPDGIVNTGGGGSAGNGWWNGSGWTNYTGGNGGSGIVIVRYVIGVA